MAKFLLKLGDTNPLAKQIRDAIGVGPYDEVEVQTPQFERTDGRRIVYLPNTTEQYDRLKTLKPDMLKELGLLPWDENGLWLFPGEWYDYIPNGYEVTVIGDFPYTTELWERGKSDDDIRFGCLAYGIVCPALEKL